MRAVIQHLTENGIGTGTSNFNGDYSITPATISIQPLTSEIFEIHSVTMYIRDVGTVDANTFGNLAALTNGITFKKMAGTDELFDFTMGDPIKDNGSLAHLSSTYQADRATGGGDSIVVGRWDFDSVFGIPIRLNGMHLESLDVVLNDNLTGLTELECVAFGHTVAFTSSEVSV